MRLNRFEFIAMNNPIRRWVQKSVEFPILDNFLKKYTINLNGSSILDVGCGSGYSTRLLRSRFNPKELIAFDFMSEQIEIARKKDLLTHYFVGDVVNIDLPSNHFDAVFVFGVLHHVPEWRKALYEIHRVLKSNGVLLIEEPNKKLLDFVDKYLHLNHPKESRFEWQEFMKELELAGFTILDIKKIHKGFQSFFCIKSIASGS